MLYGDNMRISVIFVGENAAQSDYAAANMLKDYLNKYGRVIIKKDTQYNLLDKFSPRRDIMIIGGPKVNKVYNIYRNELSPPYIDVSGNDVYIVDEDGNTCYRDAYSYHIGVIQTKRLHTTSIVDKIKNIMAFSGLDRWGTIGAVKAYIKYNIVDCMVLCYDDGEPYSYKKSCMSIPTGL